MIVFATDDSDDLPFSCDTDGIPFFIDNSATEIISKEHRFFTRQFKPMSVTLETAEGLTTTKKLMGILHLVLTDKSSNHHVYKTPQCIMIIRAY